MGGRATWLAAIPCVIAGCADAAAALTMVTGMIWLGAMPAAAMYTVALPAVPTRATLIGTLQQKDSSGSPHHPTHSLRGVGSLQTPL